MVLKNFHFLTFFLGGFYFSFGFLLSFFLFISLSLLSLSFLFPPSPPSKIKDAAVRQPNTNLELNYLNFQHLKLEKLVNFLVKNFRFRGFSDRRKKKRGKPDTLYKDIHFLFIPFFSFFYSQNTNEQNRSKKDCVKNLTNISTGS